MNITELNEIIEILLWVISFALCIISVYSDLMYGKVYNKVLFVFLIIGIILDVFYYGFTSKNQFAIFTINFIIVTIISLIMFYAQLLAGGDCKLFIVLALLYPAGFYLVIKDSKITLFYVIILALIFGYFYLLINSIRNIITRKNKISFEDVKKHILKFIKSYLIAILYIAFANIIIFFSSIFDYKISPYLFTIICILLSFSVGKFKIFKSKPLVGVITALVIISSIYLRTIPFNVNFRYYILVFVLMIFQFTIKTNIYQLITVTDLKKGMILSCGSSMVMQQQKSIISGLPNISKESLSNKLTDSEILSIKTWAKLKKVKQVTIVKKIPFVLFILLGQIFYSVWSVFF